MSDSTPIIPRKTLSLGIKNITTNSDLLLQKSIKNLDKQTNISQNNANPTDSRLKLIEQHEQTKNEPKNDFLDIINKNIVNNDFVDAVNVEPIVIIEPVKVVSHVTTKAPIKQDVVSDKFETKALPARKGKKGKSTASIGEAANVTNATKYVLENVEEITEDEYNVAEYEKLYGRPLIIKSSVTNSPPAQRRHKKESFNRNFKKPTMDKVFLEISVDGPMIVKDLAEVMNIKVNELVRSLMKMGLMLTANQSVDPDTIELIAGEHGHQVVRLKADKYAEMLKSRYVNVNKVIRPPVVTIMGHVDHGKTSLLDAIRNADIAADEAGGITQHIGAYTVKTKNGEPITFIDTPGHEAFSDMRSRGAKITDIVILVVAADDGIMPQTVEAIKHAKNANVPIIVAINKIDKPGANINKVRESLMQYDLLPEEYGGTVMTVPVSAATKENLDKLLETIILQAEVMELTSLDVKYADGTILESRVDKQKGIVTTILVQNGTIKQGDIIVSGVISGKARMMINDKGEQIANAGPSVPVEIIGLENGGTVGDPVYIMANEKDARALIDVRKAELLLPTNEAQNDVKAKINAESVFSEMRETNKRKMLYFVIKADMRGSLEVVKKVIERIKHEEFTIKILSSSVGAVTDSDVEAAKTEGTSAIILAFNAKVDSKVSKFAQMNNIKILDYSIIYHLEDAVKALASELLAPIRKEEHIGTALVKQIFSMTKGGKIAGCTVTKGKVQKGSLAKVIRGESTVYTGSIENLRHLKDEVKEVISGRDCGIKLAGFEEISINDRIEIFCIVEEKRFLD